MKVQNDFLNAMDKQQVTMLLLLDLSADFDTVDHKILIERIGNMVGFSNRTWVKDHMAEICGRSFHQLRTVVQVLISSKLHCNNKLYYGIANYQLQRLQRIQNAAARIIIRKRKYEYITPSLMELHWLPIRSRILFKILVLTYKYLHGMAPTYLLQSMGTIDL